MMRFCMSATLRGLTTLCSHEVSVQKAIFISITLLAALTGFTHIPTNILSTSIYYNLLNDAVSNSDNNVK